MIELDPIYTAGKVLSGSRTSVNWKGLWYVVHGEPSPVSRLPCWIRSIYTQIRSVYNLLVTLWCRLFRIQSRLIWKLLPRLSKISKRTTRGICDDNLMRRTSPTGVYASPEDATSLPCFAICTVMFTATCGNLQHFLHVIDFCSIRIIGMPLVV